MNGAQANGLRELDAGMAVKNESSQGEGKKEGLVPYSGLLALDCIEADV